MYVSLSLYLSLYLSLHLSLYLTLYMSLYLSMSLSPVDVPASVYVCMSLLFFVSFHLFSHHSPLPSYILRPSVALMETVGPSPEANLLLTSRAEIDSRN